MKNTTFVVNSQAVSLGKSKNQANLERKAQKMGFAKALQWLK